MSERTVIDYPAAFARARKCLRAAELRAQGVGWHDIQRELEIDHPVKAKQFAERGHLILRLAEEP